MKHGRAALHNLGCKVNAYETEAMQQLLEEAGYEIVSFDEEADVYVVNTCTVTNIADRKSRQMLHRARRLNPDAVTVAVGCYVQSRGSELLKDGSADIIIGVNEKGTLVERIDEFQKQREGNQSASFVYQQSPDDSELRSDMAYENIGITKTAEHTRAFLKVQDGCSQFCTYCVIPYVRGRIRSRSPEDALREVEILADSGYREVVLTGIHLSSYGLDMDEESRTAEAPFGHGLQRLILAVSEVPGIERIRLGSLEPRIVTDEFAAALSECPKICPHFHLSLQSGSDTVLKRMNRHYTAEEYLDRCELLRKYFDSPAITTDVIAGFPGETEEEFAQTKDFVQQVHFYEMHVFPYSRRAGTPADRMPGQVDDSVKKARAHELSQLSERMSREYREACVGREAEVLLEDADEDGMMSGYTREYVRVSCQTGTGMSGQLARGKIACRNGKYILE